MSAQSIATALKPRIRVSADGLQNVYSGMGTERSQSSYNQWRMNWFMNGPVIDAIYRESWLAQRICAAPAKDAVRQWRTFACEDAEDIQRYEKRIGLQKATSRAKTLARAYGGAGILMITDQPLDKPLEIKKIKRGSLRKLIVLDRFDLTAPMLNINNVLKDNYLLPEYYMLVNGSQRIHWTHVARFEGLELPRRLAQIEQGWGDSELRRVLQDINMTVASFMGIGQLMQQANVDVITKEGLASDLTTGEDEQIIERYQLFNLMKSNYGLSLLDATETLDRKALSLTGVAQVQEQLVTWISGAAEMPISRLFGRSAKGMNATGEGDENVYNDKLASMQTDEIAPPLTHVDEVMVRSALGDYPEDCDFTWNPLRQMDDEEQATVDYTRSQSDATWFDLGVVKKSQIMKRLQSQDTYQIMDEDIAEMEKQEAEEAAMDDLPDDDFELTPPTGPGGNDNEDDNGDQSGNNTQAA